MIGLTLQQRRLYDFVVERISSSGVCPSYNEMQDHLALKSKSGVFRLIEALEERGLITKLPGRARALSLVHQPSTSSPESTVTIALIRYRELIEAETRLKKLVGKIVELA